MSEPLKDGMDPGAVLPKVKRQVFVNGIGICAAPNCSNRLMQNRTTLGECAHIIPRKVGSHPREDYATSLEDRNKEPNLLYLCLMHHKIVDDKEHADSFTADVLRKWKNDHETWASGITKNSPYLPQESKDILANIETRVAEQMEVSETIIRTLLDTCRDLLNRQLINEARAFLAQIDILLLDANNESLNAEADLLNSRLSIRNEQITEAKRQLLEIIQSYPHNVEAMLEYVELCKNAPEPDDEAEKVENLAYALANDHPKFSLIDLAQKFKKRESVEVDNIHEVWASDKWLNSRFIRQYALFCDLAHQTAKRDELINRLEKELPTSPHPHLYRVFFRVFDFNRQQIRPPAEQLHQILEISEFITIEREKASSKDPLTVRDQISWLLKEISLELAYAHFSGAGKNIGELIDTMISLIKQCYFDSFIDAILVEFLSKLRIEDKQWRVITDKIQESNVIPSQAVIESLFLLALEYHDELQTDLDRFIHKYGYDDLLQILQSIKDGDVQDVAERVNAKNNSNFSLLLLGAIADNEIVSPLMELLKVDEDREDDLLFTRFKALVQNKLDAEALDLIDGVPIDQFSAYGLHLIEQTAYRIQRWHLFIAAALRLFEFNVSQSYRIQLHGELASVYFHQGDDTNAIIHAEQALREPEALGEENLQVLLHILGQSLLRKGLPDEACYKLQEYGHIKRSFPLLLDEVELYLKSGFADKYEKALSLILRAFEEADVYDDRLYFSALTLLVELDNARIIPHEDEPSVEDGLFVKLEGFRDGWFFVGEKGTSLGAEWIRPGTANYNTVIHKLVSQEVEWPADKFSTPNARRKILHIASAPSYLSWRALEAMQNIASTGNAPVWMFQVPIEEGIPNTENLEKFYNEHLQSDKFFETYITTTLPFSFLCRMEGGLAQAIGRISSERKGFIRCNSGTQADMDAQEVAATGVLNGADCFIDGLSALMLSEGKLLKTVINAVPHLSVSTSVIKLLRTIAQDLASVSSSIGRGAFVEGKFVFLPRDKESEEAFGNLILQSADLLDQLPNKVIGKSYPKLDDDTNWDHILPDYFVDPFRYSQEYETFLLTDDAFLIEGYKLRGESPLPKNFSSFSLVALMAKNNQIDWDTYFNFFALLSGYRYQFLRISAEDMIRVIFPDISNGSGAFTPRNINLLNLPLTLSQEYGVSDQSAAGVLSTFFTRLIFDDRVSLEMAHEIFVPTIMQGLVGRDRKQMATQVLQFCNRSILDKNWVITKSEIKLEILKKQLAQFAQGGNLL